MSGRPAVIRPSSTYTSSTSPMTMSVPSSSMISSRVSSTFTGHSLAMGAVRVFPKNTSKTLDLSS